LLMAGAMATFGGESRCDRPFFYAKLVPLSLSP
jgi:hypothetical protein